MANGVPITPGTGVTIATDQVPGTAEHIQLVKLVDGTEDSVNRIPGDGGGLRTKDDYAAGEVLADQAGADAVLTFTFSAPVQLAVVESVGATSRADPFGTMPAAALGIRCTDAVPVFLPVTTTVVKVYAPTGATVIVHGYRR